MKVLSLKQSFAKLVVSGKTKTSTLPRRIRNQRFIPEHRERLPEQPCKGK